MLAELEREGRRPKFIYTVPTFQNPAGVTLSLERRRRLVEIAQQREILVLEDDPYGVLRYEGEELPTLYELDGGHFVVYAGTFSKILSPGLRLGWAVAPRPVLEKLNLGAQGATLCPSPFTQLFVAAYFATGALGGYIGELRDLYRRRRDAMLEALEHAPAGGGDMDAPAGRAVRLGDAARVPRHDRSARARAVPQRGLRAGARGVPRRARRILAAAQLLGQRRGGHPRGRAAGRRDRPRAGRPLRRADRPPARPLPPRGARSRSRARRRSRTAAPPQARGAQAKDEPGAAGRRAPGRALAGAPGLARLRCAASPTRWSGSGTS